MIVVLQIVLRLLTDLIALTVFAFRRRRATAAEILVLRRQIALYKERGVKQRRIDAVTRISLALLSRFFNWRDARASEISIMEDSSITSKSHSSGESSLRLN